MDRSTSSAGWALVWRTVRSLDLLLALLCAVIFTLVTLLSSRPLEDVSITVGAAAVPLGVAAGVAALVMARWLHDKLDGSEYGELLRVMDPESLKAQLPFYVVAGSCLLTSITGVFLVVTHGELSRTTATLVYGLLLLLVCYDLFGLLSLGRITLGHKRRMSRLAGWKEGEARRKRGAA